MPNGQIIDVTVPKLFAFAGFQPKHETVLIIHGFNGTQSSEHIRYLVEGDKQR